MANIDFLNATPGVITRTQPKVPGGFQCVSVSLERVLGVRKGCCGTPGPLELSALRHTGVFSGSHIFPKHLEHILIDKLRAVHARVPVPDSSENVASVVEVHVHAEGGPVLIRGIRCVCVLRNTNIQLTADQPAGEENPSQFARFKFSAGEPGGRSPAIPEDALNDSSGDGRPCDGPIGHVLRQGLAASKKGVRLTQTMQVGPRIPVETQL